jgi:carboxyl-terminal processing protease
MTPLPGTPAYKAGVRAGDVILSINGKSTEGFKTQDAVEMLKGKPGEEVKITVLHLGKEETEEIPIVRDVIQLATVRGDHYLEDGHWDYMADPENKIGYIRLTNFSRRSADELREALETLKAQGMKGLIFDLRFNPGGLLSQATEISDMFVESGKIVSTKGKNTPEREWTATKEGTYSGFPMAVLVNRYSASASEIVSACLQDHERAEVIGERTWGKGSVQNVIQLENGESALKLTTASYHRPSGKNIHRFPDAKEEDEWGVMPKADFLVKFSDEELEQYHDFRAEKDILGGKEPPKSEFKDRQFAKAMEFVIQKLNTADKPAEPAEKKDAEAKAGDKPAEPAAAGAKSDDQSSVIELDVDLLISQLSDLRAT